MFRLELHELLSVYTGLCLGVVLVAAVLHNFRRHRREALALRHLVKCQSCAFEFRDGSGAEFPACPACRARVRREPLSLL